MKFSKADEDAPQFVLKDNESYQDGQFSVQLSYFRGKVYCHLQNNKKGSQTSIPIDVMMALWEIKEDLQAAADTLTNYNAAPPSPPLIPLKKRRTVVLKKKAISFADDDDDDILEM